MLFFEYVVESTVLLCSFDTSFTDVVCLEFHRTSRRFFKLCLRCKFAQRVSMCRQNTIQRSKLHTRFATLIDLCVALKALFSPCSGATFFAPPNCGAYQANVDFVLLQ